jgi:phosphoribosylformylglycinamidine (FGAM) synthase-like enzyme
MSANGNRLRKLVQQFEALPRQQELKQTKIQLSTTANKVVESADRLKASFGQLAALREIQAQPDLLVSEIAQKMKILRATVQLLDQQIQPAGVAAKLTVALDNLAKVGNAISEQIALTWGAADTDLLGATQALIELTGKYDAAAQRTLRQALTNFKSCGNPDGEEALVRYSEARASLLKARTALNIPGNVGKFLNDTARGKGSVKALLDPEIQSFLAEHPALWSQLTVKFS